MAKKAAVPVTEGLIQLDPAVILMDDNPRYGLRNVDALAESILAQGGIIEPVEVEPIQAPNGDGKLYRLTVGFRRVAAIEHLNKTAGAGLLVPAIVHTTSDATDRLKRQLAENMERENQSPMDMAISIKKLQDLGMSRAEIRVLYAPSSSKKSGKSTMMSNSMYHKLLRLLEFPEGIQDKIHDGRIGIAGAFALIDVPAAKRKEVVDSIEADRKKLMEREEKEEEKYLNQEKKTAEEKEKQETLRKTLEIAEKDNDEAAAVLAEADKVATAAFTEFKAKHDTKEETKKASESFKAATAALKAAEKAAETAKNVYDKHFQTFTRAQEAEAERAAKLKESKAAKATPSKEVVGSAEVKEAAKKTGASTTVIALTLKELREAIGEVALPGGNPKVQAIGAAYRSMSLGELTPAQLCKALEKIVGK